MTKEATKIEITEEAQPIAEQTEAVTENAEEEAVEEQSAEADVPADKRGAAEEATPAMRWLVALLRVVTGGVFIFSGFVKAIDPWGGYYKFQEYFLALGLNSLYGISLFAAFSIAFVELMLGVSLLLGLYRRSAPVLALAMMAVMLPMTLYLAVTDAVADCGCFGDALVMSNWVTFLKNIVLTVLLFLLLKHNRKLPSVYGPAVQWVVLFLTFVTGLVIALNGYFNQPMLDFRPFPVGSHFEVAPAPSDEDYTFIYSKDGEEREFALDEVPDEDSGWTFVDRRQKTESLSPAQLKSRQSLSILDEGDDVTATALDPERRQLLYLFPDLKNVSISYTFLINELTEKAHLQDIDVYGITSGTRQEMDEWNDISLAGYPLYTADDSDIKMLARGNPAVVYVERGVVKWKRTLSSIRSTMLDDPELTVDKMAPSGATSGLMKIIFWLFVVPMLVLLAINRGFLLFGFLGRKHKNSENNATFADENE